jgi:hypothetical protein
MIAVSGIWCFLYAGYIRDKLKMGCPCLHSIEMMCDDGTTWKSTEEGGGVK